MAEPASSTPPTVRPSEDRLDSWKEIAAYLDRDVTTVQRWEKREGMPVYRHLHDRMGSVYASRAELDSWTRSRNLSATQEIGAGLWLHKTEYFWRNPIADARFQTVTEFDGLEQAAAISRDGHLVAFLSNRDGPMDVWVTQVDSGQFHNLTHGSVRELVNPSIRTLGFSPDGSMVTFWVRKPGGPGGNTIDTWAVSTLGGEPRPYLEGAAEFDWSHDGSKLAYHTPG